MKFLPEKKWQRIIIIPLGVASFSLILLIIVATGWNLSIRRNVRSAFSIISVPNDWKLESTDESGDAFCLDLCTTKSSSYRVELDKNRAPAIFRKLIEDTGFRVVDSDSKCELPINVFGDGLSYCSAEGKKDTLTMSITLSPSFDPRRTPPADQSAIPQDIVSIAIRYK